MKAAVYFAAIIIMIITVAGSPIAELKSDDQSSPKVSKGNLNPTDNKSAINQKPKSEWLTARLYGNDNRIAALRKVDIYTDQGELRVYIENQFQFDCEIELDERGRPATLSNCMSQLKAMPKCVPDRPDSLCARSSGCFQELPETNPNCFYIWQVKETAIKLRCFNTKTESICRGKYTLKSSDDDSGSRAEMTIAKRRK